MTRTSTLLAAFAAACLLAVPTAAATSESDVARSLRSLKGGVGAYVYDVGANRAVASRNAGAKRIIASNAKLFTGAAVLEKFGTGGRFSTGVWSDGVLGADGVLLGDIYLRGGGDPYFGSDAFVRKNFGSQATVENLAAAVEAAGVKRVTGRIWGDETVFDARRGTAKYGFRASGEIGGLLSGLVYNKGYNAGRFQSDPPRFAAQRLRVALRAVGVRVTSKIGVGATPNSARRIASVNSLPMASLVRQMNKPSNNYLAEMLIKSLALPAAAADPKGGTIPLGSKAATTRAGGSFARRHAASMGSRVSLADGSGLSRSDRAAPREVVDILKALTKESESADFNASLPIAGIDGTLNKRMRGTAAQRRCQAKTGTLSNVSALSGYCSTSGGRKIAFSILQNSVTPYLAKNREDRIVATIAALD